MAPATTLEAGITAWTPDEVQKHSRRPATLCRLYAATLPSTLPPQGALLRLLPYFLLQVAAWLTDTLYLPDEVAATFRVNAVCGSDLASLTDADLLAHLDLTPLQVGHVPCALQEARVLLSQASVPKCACRQSLPSVHVCLAVCVLLPMCSGPQGAHRSHQAWSAGASHPGSWEQCDIVASGASCTGSCSSSTTNSTSSSSGNDGKRRSPASRGCPGTNDRCSWPGGVLGA